MPLLFPCTNSTGTLYRHHIIHDQGFDVLHSEESFMVFLIWCYGAVAIYIANGHAALDNFYTHPLISGSLLVSHMYASVLSYTVVCAMITNGRNLFDGGSHAKFLG